MLWIKHLQTGRRGVCERKRAASGRFIEQSPVIVFYGQPFFQSRQTRTRRVETEGQIEEFIGDLTGVLIGGIGPVEHGSQVVIAVAIEGDHIKQSQGARF